MAPKTWYEQATPGDSCAPDQRCPEAETNGNCDYCDTIDGRWIDAVAEYAQTCDGCMELSMNEDLEQHPETGVWRCGRCRLKENDDG